MRIPRPVLRRLQRWANRYMQTHPIAQKITGQVPQDLLILRWDVFDMPFFHVRLHRVIQSDDARALHDHPWWSVSVIVAGAYQEVVPWGGRSAFWQHQRRAGDVVFRNSLARHRLVLHESCYRCGPDEPNYPLPAQPLTAPGAHVRGELYDEVVILGPDLDYNLLNEAMKTLGGMR